MRKTSVAGSLTVLLTLLNVLPLQGQAFEWMQPYEQICANVNGEDVQVSPLGGVFSLLSYWDIPPIREAGTVLEKYDPSGNRSWGLAWDGRGSNVEILFTCGNDENLYILHPYRRVEGEYADFSRYDPRRRLVWDTTLAGGYDKVEATRDRIYAIGFPEDTSDSYVATGFTIVQFDTLSHEVWRRDSVFA